MSGLLYLYRYFRGREPGWYETHPRSRRNALYMAWGYWRKGAHKVLR